MRIVPYFLLLLLVSIVLAAHDTAENGSNLDDAFGDEDMTSLLHWAIEHSDPEKLREQAESMSKEDIKQRRERVEEESLDVLRNSSASEVDVIHSLRSLQVHVERIDNANDLKNMDGIECVVSQLEYHDKRSSEAAIVLGVAASNNPTFQKHLIEADPLIFSKLIKLLNSQDQIVTGNSLYAISTLLRNLESMRTLFYTNGGLTAIHEVLMNNMESVRLKRKCLALLADLIQLEDLEITDEGLVKLIVSLLKDENWDIVEKASITIFQLAQKPQSLAKLKDLDLGPVLASRKNSAIYAIQKSDEKSEYLHEIVQYLDKLIQLFQLEEHVEL
eukprot:g141.t1